MRKITFPKGEGLPTCNYGSKKLGHRGRRAAQSFYKVTFMMGDKKGALVLVLFLSLFLWKSSLQVPNINKITNQVFKSTPFVIWSPRVLKAANTHILSA